jgi:uncharacterized NAD(P)/FAD-binding protein YdhS
LGKSHPIVIDLPAQRGRRSGLAQTGLSAQSASGLTRGRHADDGETSSLEGVPDGGHARGLARSGYSFANTRLIRSDFVGFPHRKSRIIIDSVSFRPDIVAIIGGGASGVLAAIHLLQGAPEPIRVVIIEPRVELGRGVAYGTTDLGHLLNVGAACMSAFPDEPGHFTEWAKRLTVTDGRAYLPRTWYGDYLRSLLEPADHIRAQAVDIMPSGDRAKVVLASGSIVTCDRVILAPGPSPQRWPVPLGGTGKRWIGNPWAPGALAGTRPEEPVLLVGTGLTAVDVALGLGAAGHQQVVATSRHGLLPLAHPDEPFPSLPIVPPSRPTARSLFDWARATVAEVGDWRKVVDALRPHTNALWSDLTEAERSRLLRHLQRRWEVVRHRMAPSVAARVSAMQETGQLVIVAGGVRSARTTRRGIDVELADRRVRVGAVVNCSGPTPDVRRSSHHLIRELLHSDVVRPGPLGLGLDTEEDGSIPGSDRKLWLVGPLRRGHHWEATAVPEIRVQAADLPQALWRAAAVVGA